MSEQYPHYDPKFDVDPETQERYHEWFYAGGATSEWAAEHPWADWLKENYPDLYDRKFGKPATG